ncbi:MAG TPA: MinD/ParA family protein [bacterium]|nr:MinD/ParA family protein [bacterium]
MTRIISVHSFRGGTGKSNLSANLAALYALAGKRVGVVDTDIQSPGIHILFGLQETATAHALNDYLWGVCSIGQCARDVTAALGQATGGSIHLVPSSVNAADIARMLKSGYDINLLGDGFHRLGEELRLDLLIIDTHPGLNEETLLSIALSQALLVVMRPDHQDYQGTGLTVEVARELEVPNLQIVVNKTPAVFDHEQIRRTVTETYHCPVAAILPHADEMMTLASQGLFAVRYPHHPITAALQQVAGLLSA